MASFEISIMTENEIDHVFIGTDSEEELNRKLLRYPEKYTSWFKQALDLALSNYR